MQPAGASEHAAQLPLRDADRVRRVPLTVEDPGDQALPAQPARGTRAARLPLANLELDSFSRHTGAQV